MSINLATQNFREDLTKIINGSGLPICNICMVLNEAKTAADNLLAMTIQSELEQKQKEMEESENGNME